MSDRIAYAVERNDEVVEFFVSEYDAERYAMMLGPDAVVRPVVDDLDDMADVVQDDWLDAMLTWVDGQDGDVL